MTDRQSSLFETDPTAPKQRTYHVQAHQTVAEVQAGETRAENQDAIVLEFFRSHPSEHFTPFEVHRALGGGRDIWPLTSTRRSLTNLTSRGLLRRHDEDRRPGEFGALNATWSLA